MNAVRPFLRTEENPAVLNPCNFNVIPRQKHTHMYVKINKTKVFTCTNKLSTSLNAMILPKSEHTDMFMLLSLTTQFAPDYQLRNALLGDWSALQLFRFHLNKILLFCLCARGCCLAETWTQRPPPFFLRILRFRYIDDLTLKPQTKHLTLTMQRLVLKSESPKSHWNMC